MSRIRSITSDDVDACVEFGIEAFRPVFASFEAHYGRGLFEALRPDWENAQVSYIRETCSDPDKETWVAVDDTDYPVGFVVLTTDDDSGLGRIELMAVDPQDQGRGVGKSLTNFGVERLREQGMTYAVVGTGSDEGHGPARGTYLSCGFEPMTIQPVYLTQRL